MPLGETCFVIITSCDRTTSNLKLFQLISILNNQAANITTQNISFKVHILVGSEISEEMDQYLLYYVILFIWLLPFSFGEEKIHSDLLDTCLDGKFHKYKPSEESELFSQCSPWKKRSCCTNSTTKSLHEPMHYNFNLDHCSSIKPISDACRTHFLQDLCFYECSPNVGPWLVKVNMKIRKERFFQVPLCESDCNDWFEACKDDFTCNGNWVRGWHWNKTGNFCPQNTTCQTFKDIFHNAHNFCEKVWDHSWKVTPNNQPCMRIWFDGEKGNPNDAVAKYYVDNPPSTNSSTINIRHFFKTLLVIMPLLIFYL